MPDSANEHLPQLKELLARFDINGRWGRILDVGMGRGSYGWWLRNEAKYAGHLTGIEIWGPYVEGDNALAGGNRGYYDKILVRDVRELTSEEAGAPDVVFAFDVLEHMPEADAVAVLRKLQRAAQKAVLVSLPIIPYPQGPAYGNPYEAHQKDWTTRELIALGGQLVHAGDVTGLFLFPPGRLDRKMSVILNTARDSEAFPGRDLLGSVAEQLAAQSFYDFEFIVVDGLFEQRWHRFNPSYFKLGRVLHVPPRQTPMVRDKRCAISAYKNTGLAHARGELVVTIDDGCLFDEGFIARYWEAHEKRREFLSALYVGVNDDGVTLRSPDALYGEVHDSRATYLDSEGRCVGPVKGNVMIPPVHGFTAFSIDAAIKVNGYDEMFDGSQGLEDLDFGMRLQRAGYRASLDLRHKVRLLAHGGWSSTVFPNPDTCVKCSQTTLRLQLERAAVTSGAESYEANRRPWSEAEWGKVAPRCYLLTDQLRCSLNGHVCPYTATMIQERACSDREHPGLRALRDEPPVFDLANLRHANGIA